RKKGIKTILHLNKEVTNIIDTIPLGKVTVEIEGQSNLHFDKVVICSGHNWIKDLENKIPGYYDSPYPPAKLERSVNQKVAIRGTPLTSFSAIRTIARANGTFSMGADNTLIYKLDQACTQLKIILHSRNGLLPAVRHYLEDPMFTETTFLSKEQIQEHI